MTEFFEKRHKSNWSMAFW